MYLLFNFVMRFDVDGTPFLDSEPMKLTTVSKISDEKVLNFVTKRLASAPENKDGRLTVEEFQLVTQNKEWIFLIREHGRRDVGWGIVKVYEAQDIVTDRL